MRGTRSSAFALASTVAVSGLLIGAAFFTVEHAGCSDPGHYVIRADGVVELVGGCIAAGDLVVPGRPETPSTPVAVVPEQGVRP